MAGTITIFWKKYNPQLPALVYRSEFDCYKSHKTFPDSYKFNYVQEFWWELVIVFLAVLCVWCEEYHWYPLNGAFGIVIYCLLFASIINLIGLVISSINYINCYVENNLRINQLKNTLLNSNTYEEFCSKMGVTDNRYIVQYEKLQSD